MLSLPASATQSGNICIYGSAVSSVLQDCLIHTFVVFSALSHASTLKDDCTHRISVSGNGSKAVSPRYLLAITVSRRDLLVSSLTNMWIFRTTIPGNRLAVFFLDFVTKAWVIF